MPERDRGAEASDTSHAQPLPGRYPTELDETQLADRIAAHVTRFMASEQISRARLSELLGKGPNYVGAFLRDRSGMGVHAFYKLCKLTKLDPNQLFQFDDAVAVSPDLSRSDELEAITLLEVALSRIRAGRRNVGRPYFDEVIAAWRTAGRDLRKLDARIKSFLDIYDPPTAEGALRPRAIGRRSLTSQVLETTDVDYFRVQLNKLPKDVTATSASNQREALSRGYLMVEREISVPLLSGKQLNLQNDLLILSMKDGADPDLIAVFPKAFGTRD